MERRFAAEHLDAAADWHPAELSRSLREVWQVNRCLGGSAVLRRHLAHLLRGAGRRASLLDVGTGAADLPLALLAWGKRRRLDLSVIAVDVSPPLVALARSRTAGAGAVWVEQADGRALPYKNKSFDVAICNLALHHLDEAGAVRLLQELDRVSRRGWIVGDLERCLPAYWAARALAALVWRSPLTRHDGPLSVQRAFTLPEARRLVAVAGVQAAVYRHFPFRLALVGGG